MTKTEVKERLKAIGARQWELAKVLEVHEKTLTCWLRDEEITTERTERINTALDKLAEAKRA